MKKVAVLLAEGFEEVEALTVVDVLRRGQITCDMVSINSEEYVKSSHNVIIKADKVLEDDLEEYDMIVLPGGLGGADNLSNSEKVLNIIRKFNENKNKFVAAICASPAVVLSKAGIIENRYMTSYPGEKFENLLENSNYCEELVVRDDNLITSRGPATTMLFAYKLLDVLGGDSKTIKAGMLWNMLESEN